MPNLRIIASPLSHRAAAWPRRAAAAAAAAAATALVLTTPAPAQTAPATPPARAASAASAPGLPAVPLRPASGPAAGTPTAAPGLTPPAAPGLTPPAAPLLQGQQQAQPKLPVTLVVTDGMGDAPPAPGATSRNVKFGACLVDADNKPLASAAGSSVQVITGSGQSFALNPALGGAMKTVQGPLGPVAVGGGGAAGQSCFEATANLPLCAPKQTVNFVAMLAGALGGGTAKAQVEFNPSPIPTSFPPANNPTQLKAGQELNWFQVLDNLPCAEPVQATLKIGPSFSVPMQVSMSAGGKATLAAVGVPLPAELGGKSLPLSIALAPSKTYVWPSPPPVTVTVERLRANPSLEMPAMATVGSPFQASGALLSPEGKPLANLPLQLIVAAEGGASFCSTTTSASGSFTCPITYNGPPSKVLVAGPEKKRFSLKLPDYVEPLIKYADVVMLGADSTLQASAPISLLQGIVADARPGGVLLNNYAGGESAVQAHLPNGSWVLTNAKDLSQGDKFDIPPFSATPYHYYVDRIFVRVADWTLAPPHHLNVALTVEGWQGTGKRLKGRCFPLTAADQALCAVGTDAAAPDVTIQNVSGQFRIALLVEGGRLVAKVDEVSNVALDFGCGGVAAPLCFAAKPTLNNLLNQQLKTRLVGMKFTQQVQAVGEQLKTKFGFKQLTKFGIGADGSLILWGKP